MRNAIACYNSIPEDDMRDPGWCVYYVDDAGNPVLTQLDATDPGADPLDVALEVLDLGEVDAVEVFIGNRAHLWCTGTMAVYR